MDADQALRRLAAHRVGDAGAHVAALGDIAGIAETAHQLGPGARGPKQVPADLGRLGGEAVTGHGRQHEVKRVLRAPAMLDRVSQRADGVEHLDHRAGPAVSHDQRQRPLVPRLHVDEVDVHAVDLGLELRERVEPRLAPAPVVIVDPVLRERPKRLQLHPLRAIRDELLSRPPHRCDAPAQVLQGDFREFNVERANRGGARLVGCGRHVDLLGWVPPQSVTVSSTGRPRYHPGLHTGRLARFICLPVPKIGPPPPPTTTRSEVHLTTRTHLSHSTWRAVDAGSPARPLRSV